MTQAAETVKPTARRMGTIRLRHSATQSSIAPGAIR
jgi:hypothetical protein